VIATLPRPIETPAPALSDAVEPAGPWHVPALGDLARRLDTDLSSGLSEREAERRLAVVGPNQLTGQEGRSPLSILREQATSTMVLILLGAAAVKAGVALAGGPGREVIDAMAILAIALLNVTLGFVQEVRAERALAALKNMAAPSVRVRRDGRVRTADARTLVPGDLVELEAGATVPADARVAMGAGLQVHEAALTGESVPVEKRDTTLLAATALGDRTNCLFFGTSVVSGRGTALVVATGMQTELGRVAALLDRVMPAPTPLQQRVSRLGAVLTAAALLVVAGMVAVGVWRGQPLLDVALAGVAVAVAAIPEGLPAILTITLALGARRLLARRTLVRRLPAVEALGAITTICSDKTGTLTENRMQVVVVDVAGHRVDLAERTRHGQPIMTHARRPAPSTEVSALLTLVALCNDAVLQTGSPDEPAVAIGDPTEGALLIAAAAHGIDRAHLDADLPRIAEAPFTSERRRMATLHRVTASAHSLPWLEVGGYAPYLLAIKGAADGLLPLATSVLDGDRVAPISADHRHRITAAADDLARKGLRVIGVALRRLASVPDTALVDCEAGLTFVGLVGLIDPPRPAVREAAAACRTAGIRPVMITGDHPLTAIEIARQLGIAGTDDRVLVGHEIDGLAPDDFDRAVADVAVFARVSPEHKLRIVEALQRAGAVVAMTGDGVNDAPALQRADVGVAMGITGTDVAKEASDVVITDDHFATIVHAIEEGRTIFDNVRKFVKYIVTSNSAEVAVLFCSQLAGMPMPMTTLQVLWMNLVTDGVPGLALALEPTEPGVMRRRPFTPGESIFSRGIGRHILVMGTLMTALALGVGAWAWQAGRPGWGTMIFMTLTLAQLGHALAARSHEASLRTIGLRSNPLMLWALAVTLVLQLLVVYAPWAQQLFGTVALTAAELALCVGASGVMLGAAEVEKWLRRRAGRTSGA
jgi:Ca2+-transporting ATPase